MSQTRVWPVAAGSVTRIHNTGAKSNQGCGGSKRLYAGRHETYDYTSWLKFTPDYTGVGKVIQATLVVYTNDFASSIDPLPTAPNLRPSVRVSRLTGNFAVGNNVDTTFDASDYLIGTYTATGVKVVDVAADANGVARIDITDFANLWAPKTALGSDNKPGGGQSTVVGVALTGISTDPNRFVHLWSDNAADGQMKPSIELVYSYGLTVPNTPSNLTPNGDVTSIGSFKGSFSDIKRGDLLAFSEVEVYTAPVTNSGQTITLNGGSKVYSKKQAESDTAILAGAFDHIPAASFTQRMAYYKWRARVTDNEGQTSAWTNLVQFRVSNTDPNAPSMTPVGKTYATLDGVQFAGTFSDPDAGDRLLAYEVQMCTTTDPLSPLWDDASARVWSSGKRLVPSGATSWSTPYGGASLSAGTYGWRARVWDNHEGVSNWSYTTITVSSNFVIEAQTSLGVIQYRPRAPWRLIIREMKFNVIGGAITGTASTDLLTSATAHKMAAGRRVRFSALTGGTGLLTGVDYYVLASGLTATAFKVSGSLNGPVVNFTTNVTAGALTAITTRGPGNIKAVIEDAYNAGASLLYNSPGEAHWTLSASHPQLSVIEPKQTHYAIEFRQGDGWREVFAGLVWDFDATNPDVVFYGIDYLALLDYCLDTRYDPANADKDYAKGGSKYTAVTIGAVVWDQLNTLRNTANYPIGFITISQTSATLAAMLAETVSVYSTYQPGLNFIAGLLDSHRAGSGKRTRLSVNKTASGYEFVVTDDPGVTRDNLRLRYGELVQAYRVIPFGKAWASRVSAVGRDKNGVKVRYTSIVAPGVDETVWGRFDSPQFIDGVNDANDFNRRVRQAVVADSKLGKQIGLAIRSNLLNPRDGYDLCDQFPVSIKDGSVDTSHFGSGYWVAVGITWQALAKGEETTTLTLQPREDSTPPSADLLTLAPISTQAEWQLGWKPPHVNIPSSKFYLDQNAGIVYERVDGALVKVGITGDV